MTFDEVLKAAFEAGKEYGVAAVRMNDGDPPDFEEWRAALPDLEKVS